jgi:hypothetical protein
MFGQISFLLSSGVSSVPADVHGDGDWLSTNSMRTTSARSTSGTNRTTTTCSTISTSSASCTGS